MNLSRRRLLGWFSALPFAGLLKRAEPERIVSTDFENCYVVDPPRTATLLERMDEALDGAKLEGRTPLSFSLGSEALREYRAHLGIGEGMARIKGPHRLFYRGIPVEPAIPNGWTLTDAGEEWARSMGLDPNPSLVHLHTAPYYPLTNEALERISEWDGPARIYE
jgi:hypothetical protein